MAKNDTILLDGILDERISSKMPSEKRDEVFEFFAIDQILKDSNLSNDELTSGLIDGRNDGGIDGFYIFVNGHLLTDSDSFFWPKTSIELEIHIITCKHHDTFKQAPFDNLTATLSEIFNLAIDKAELRSDYNDELIKKRELLKIAYRKLSPRLATFSVRVSYASRGDTASIGESIISRGDQIIKLTQELFGGCSAKVLFYGSTELVELSRKTPNFALELPFLEVLARGERYVLLSKISDYSKFISDEQGKLRRYLFDSNVRDFMGLNRVNEDIKTTLENEDSPDFWWLNNGVTILATSARVIGKTIHIEDIQIVNGLQTTESIHKYFDSGAKDPKERSVLVKVIVSKQNEVRDLIIRATNNQTNVELSALHATDKVQRDIEDILGIHGLYYERRTNHYTNQGIPSSQIVRPLYLASGFVSLVLKDLNKAANLKSRFMRSPASYELVFSQKTTLDIWPKIGWILKKTDLHLERMRAAETITTDRFLKRWRHILAYLSVSKILLKLDFTPSELSSIDLDKLDEPLLEETWLFIKTLNSDRVNKGHSVGQEDILTTFKFACEKFKIDGFSNFSNRARRSSLSQIDQRQKTAKLDNMRNPRWSEIDKRFVKEVNRRLPPQPWKPGMHIILAKELNCTTDELAKAIDVLVYTKKIYKQKDGVLYNSEGRIVDYDKDRVDPISMKLKNV